MQTLTHDGIFRGRITVFQPPRGEGYRFAVDSVLLGAFASARRAATAVDLGAGSGIVGFILLHAGAAGTVHFVERDELLARACRRGLKANGFESRGSVIRADARSAGWVSRLRGVDLVVCNPPFRKKGSGWTSPKRGVASARHEITMRMEDVTARSAELLRGSGRLCLVMPPDRLDDVLRAASASRLGPVRMRFIHAKPSRNACGVLIELKPSTGKSTAVTVLPPLVIHREDGAYAPEVSDILEGRLVANV